MALQVNLGYTPSLYCEQELAKRYSTAQITSKTSSDVDKEHFKRCISNHIGMHLYNHIHFSYVIQYLSTSWTEPLLVTK